MSNRASVPSIDFWEQSKGLAGVLKAFLPVCGAILFKPADFFKRSIFSSGPFTKTRLVRAIIFALFLGYLKLFFDALNLYWLKAISKDVFSFSSGLELSFLSNAILRSPFFLLRPLLTFVVTMILVVGGVKLVLGMERAVRPAFLVVCYKSAADLFYCIPIVGSVLAVVWSLSLIIIGIREVYSVNTVRSVFAAVVMPFMILFLIALSLGPSLNKMIGSFYPEAQTQMAKFNDMNAYLNTAAITSAAQNYKGELGFYPVHLGMLKKYISGSVPDEIFRQEANGGYLYFWRHLDDKHFILQVMPLRMKETGKFNFYSDDTGKVRLNDASGPWIENAEKMDRLIAGDKIQ